MKCSGCGHESPPDSRFCLECGAAFMVRCARCGADLPARARFCNHCGAATEEAELAPERSPRASICSPGRRSCSTRRSG